MVEMSGVDRTMLHGTEGNPDYLVVGNIDGMALGVKPVAVPQPQGTFIGWRIRLCNYEGTDTLLNIEKTLANSNAVGFNWSKVDETRASAMVGAQVPIKLDEPPTTTVNKLTAGNFIKHLRENLGKDFKLDQPIDDIDFFVEQGLLVEFKKIQDLIMEAMMQMGGDNGSDN